MGTARDDRAKGPGQPSNRSRVAVPADPVNHPQHYGGEEDYYEAIKVIEAWKLGFHEGNTLKYLKRWRQKNGVADLKKAMWYLNRLIELEERNAQTS